MDLRSVLNNSDNGDRGRQPDRDRAPPAQAPPTPQQQQPPPHLQQSPSQYHYRSEYGHPAQPHRSPGKPPVQDYPPHPGQHPQHPQHQASQGASYPSHPQSPYQVAASYPNRPPPPPPLQPTNSFHDPRSPMLAPSPTAYRAASTPTASSSTARGYPFPPTHGPPNEMTSPSMRQQTHLPPQYQHSQPPPQRQDSYSHGPGPGQYHSVTVISQTPPVAAPGGPHSFIHQRSQSAQSTPTPTSAHSQHHYGPPPIHGSPVSAHQIPPSVEYQRQQSQPATPLGPPLPVALGQPGPPPGSFPPSGPQSQPQTQPSSPYQQRTPSVPVASPGQTKSSPPQPQARSQEPPHPPVQHIPGTNNTHNAHRTGESPAIDHHRRPTSIHDREHSLSVSPKTRVPSLHSNSERNSVSLPVKMMIDSEPATTPAKRKLDDRDLSPQELEHKDTRPPPGEINGKHVPGKSLALPGAPKTQSPTERRKKRVNWTEKPIWAQSIHTLGKNLPQHANFVLQKRAHNHVNGASKEGAPKTPEAVKSQPPRHSQTTTAPPSPGPQDILGAWEHSITGVEPIEEIPRVIADFLFVNIVGASDIQEITNRGIKFEIEAKLGTLIDKDTNRRVDRLLASEAILESNNRTAFRSSMTEAQHKAFNEFLNQTVIETDPRNPNTGKQRVQVHYKHRREVDSFVELPRELQDELPGCMLSRLGRKNVRARITHDQKTGQILNTIVKARVADIDLHLPTCPMDCRISINLEMDWRGSTKELEQLAASQAGRQPNRNKDRLSYTHGHYQIDLTQVTQQVNLPGGASRSEKEHELEIEISPDVLLDQGQRAMNNAPHRYQELVKGFLNNVRILARKAREFS
ncbi:unnamed protein product [Clonostachys rosea]|uniref:mRNA-capping enzyme subunit beta n=1 Tax=Bionectria ochroleuca TaxID=29856 RepID=A0ABY6V555_BIOOC|nr:unnamed protein product [Clonostachys rosea]